MGTKDKTTGYKTITKFTLVVRRALNTPGVRQHQLLTFLQLEGKKMSKVDVSRMCTQAVMNGFLREVDGNYYPGDLFLGFVKREIS